MSDFETTQTRFSYDIDPVFLETAPGFDFDAAGYEKFLRDNGISNEVLDRLHVSFQQQWASISGPDKDVTGDYIRYEEDQLLIRIFNFPFAELHPGFDKLHPAHKQYFEATLMSRTLLHESGHLIDDQGGSRRGRIRQRREFRAAPVEFLNNTLFKAGNIIIDEETIEALGPVYFAYPLQTFGGGVLAIASALGLVKSRIKVTENERLKRFRYRFSYAERKANRLAHANDGYRFVESRTPIPID